MAGRGVRLVGVGRLGNPDADFAGFVGDLDNGVGGDGAREEQAGRIALGGGRMRGVGIGTGRNAEEPAVEADVEGIWAGIRDGQGEFV